MDVGSPAAPASSCWSASSRGYTAACSSNACLDPFGAGQLNFFGDLAALADPAAFARHEPAAPPATDGDCAKRDGEAVATSSKSQAGNAPRAELTGLIDSKCVILAAAANGLPLEFFGRVILGRKPVSVESRRADDKQRPSRATGSRNSCHTAAQRLIP